MTMPHLMNCSHSDSGWCLDCVKKMYDEQCAGEMVAKIVSLVDALQIHFDSLNLECRTIVSTTMSECYQDILVGDISVWNSEEYYDPDEDEDSDGLTVDDCLRRYRREVESLYATLGKPTNA